MEDLLDSWPGTLLVVSHDRYLLERVTDQQYAVLTGADGVGRLRHLPGGVEEYLRLRARAETPSGSVPAGSPAAPSASTPPPAPADAPLSGAPLSGAERRTLEKELAALERRIAKLGDDIARRDAAMAEHDPADYAGLAAAAADAQRVRDELADAEERWLEVSSELDG
ncbi:MAG: hypothetical protein J0G30_06780 [Actinomycetales bacterium]|nr:hypothetical protein [Actinomycetales bacterium]